MQLQVQLQSQLVGKGREVRAANLEVANVEFRTAARVRSPILMVKMQSVSVQFNL